MTVLHRRQVVVLAVVAAVVAGSPLASAAAVLAKPSNPVSMTVAAGTTPPVSSVTRPRSIEF